MTRRPLFMFEDLRVAAGQVTVSEAMALARTEEDQLELAVREHAQLVYRIAFSVLRNHHDAEDATQETFLRVLRARRKLAGVDDPRRWLARIAWRVAARKKIPVRDVKFDDVEEVAARLQSPAEAVDLELIAAEATTLLRPLIEGLPRKLREPLILSTVEEMATADIAATLGTTEAAVRSRLFRARQILKEKLAKIVGAKR